MQSLRFSKTEFKQLAERLRFPYREIQRKTNEIAIRLLTDKLRVRNLLYRLMKDFPKVERDKLISNLIDEIGLHPDFLKSISSIEPNDLGPFVLGRFWKDSGRVELNSSIQPHRIQTCLHELAHGLYYQGYRLSDEVIQKRPPNWQKYFASYDLSMREGEFFSEYFSFCFINQLRKAETCWSSLSDSYLFAYFGSIPSLKYIEKSNKTEVAKK